MVAGIVTTLIGPILPILIGRWSLTDQHAGLFFTAQFSGSMAGVASLGWLIQRGYRHAFVCGFSLIAAGVAGLNLGSYVASLAAAAVFGCGLGQVLSATNLWVAEVAKTRRVAALSILNLMWGLGAISSSPLVMLAERRGATAWLLYAIAVGALFTALILAGMNLERGTTEEEEQRGPARAENISTRSTVSLAALFFLYVGSENSVAGWVASLTKRTNPGSGDLWALTPMFFWGGLLAGRARTAGSTAAARTHAAGERFDVGSCWHLPSARSKDLRKRRNLGDRRRIGTSWDLSHPGCVAGKGIWREVKANRGDYVRACGNGGLRCRGL
ncbi:MAG: hypothetical protein DMG76_24365 [Acidobacteria bacterium]|nr:MAG: hypothetical protein DMG76_24365 [Acidobacteriota bacterium]